MERPRDAVKLDARCHGYDSILKQRQFVLIACSFFYSGRQQFETLNAQRLKDQQRFPDELQQVQARAQADRERAEAWTERVQAEMAEGLANYSVLESKVATSEMSMSQLH